MFLSSTNMDNLFRRYTDIYFIPFMTCVHKMTPHSFMFRLAFSCEACAVSLAWNEAFSTRVAHSYLWLLYVLCHFSFSGIYITTWKTISHWSSSKNTDESLYRESAIRTLTTSVFELSVSSWQGNWNSIYDQQRFIRLQAMVQSSPRTSSTLNLLFCNISKNKQLK